jgi:chorismate-pyruvate lyase
MTSSQGTPLDLSTLIGLFYEAPERLGHFEPVAADAMPPVYARLLAHHEHMTVTVESHHGCPVDVRVLAWRLADGHYARKILLCRHTDGVVVQFGIMRVDFAQLPGDVRREIESRGEPLGRILIRHNVLVEVQLQSLWKVTPGPDLRQAFGQPDPITTYGRTALIRCNGQPAVELLEIVAPQ